MIEETLRTHAHFTTLSQHIADGYPAEADGVQQLDHSSETPVRE